MSWRSNLRARPRAGSRARLGPPPGPSLAPLSASRGPTPGPSRSHSHFALVTLLLLGGCSTANDIGRADSSSGISVDDDSGDTGVSDSAVAGDSSSAGQDSADGDSGEDGGASTGQGGDEPPSELPSPEPSAVDIVSDANKVGVDECDLDTPVQIALRCLDAAATVSPTQARDAALSDWVSLTGIRIRPWEFFNYYAFSYPAPEPGGITITPQLLADVASDQPEYTLQIGVAAQGLAAELRPPVHLTLALDNSNSMAGKAQDMLRATGKAIAGNLRKGDTLSIVTWNAKNSTVLELHPVSGPDDALVLEKLDQLVHGGSAELYSGLMSAYKLAEAGYDASAWNRIILISDGGATANDTDLAVIADHASKSGIYLTGVGVGDAGIYRSDMNDAAAHAGRGASMFIGSEAEAAKRFGEQFVRTLGPAIRDVKVELELPPGFEVFRDPETNSNESGLTPDSVRVGPNGALVLHRRLRSCIDLEQQDLTAELHVSVSYIDEATGQLKFSKTAAKLGDLLAKAPAAQSSLHKGIAVLAYADALQRWQARPPDLQAVLTQATAKLEAALAVLPNDAELLEMLKVIDVLSND